MADVEGAMPLAARLSLKESLLQTPDPLILALPKVELHLHIEGILSPALKWKFATCNNIQLRHPSTNRVFASLSEYSDSHDPMKFHSKTSGSGDTMNNSEETLSFFEAYYGGFEVLKTKQDYYDLGMHYFHRAAEMNVRYCELFFDPQGHTKTGVSWEIMMGGFREAQEEAERELNVRSSWIMCFLRDSPPEEAMAHYLAALPYRDMIVGIGLDSYEVDRPPSLFAEVFARARADGFKITAHCDVGSCYPLSHIHSVVTELGMDRLDHGLNAAASPETIASIKARGGDAGAEFGLTICPWSYIRHQPLDDVFRHIRTLFDAGIKMAISCDDPAFMEDTWIVENLFVVKRYCGFTDEEMVRLARDAVGICWAPGDVKEGILDEIGEVGRGFGVGGC
ncbi:hypothetical protein LTR56_012595 [Elasticomyces elasticus]|nr:hypothetical protein LTR22_018470 [Elasticomyces elasticus]KAK3639235.1 hypothetical protein LTR56_012595 [Elasticomyces elasticus]KAK4912539.1 hypothetical protein LTR49_019006 [Elasticomyces elasticus]KAK5751919.1 hypothetical protein LTS12_018025 [Elasticomyces elasticus]